jgi:hypothetical protein
MIEGFQWLQNPFIFHLTDQGLLTKQYEELMDISTNMVLKDTYTKVPITSGLV